MGFELTNLLKLKNLSFYSLWQRRHVVKKHFQTGSILRAMFFTVLGRPLDKGLNFLIQIILGPKIKRVFTCSHLQTVNSSPWITWVSTRILDSFVSINFTASSQSDRKARLKYRTHLSNFLSLTFKAIEFASVFSIRIRRPNKSYMCDKSFAAGLN